MVRDGRGIVADASSEFGTAPEQRLAFEQFDSGFLGDFRRSLFVAAAALAWLLPFPAGRGIRLTAAGAAFAPYATDVLGLLERGRTAAREASSVAARRIYRIRKGEALTARAGRP